MTKHEARERLVQTVFTRVRKVQRLRRAILKAQPTQPEILAAEAKPYEPPEHHHIIATSVNSTRNIYSLLREYPEDPALEVSVYSLRRGISSAPHPFAELHSKAQASPTSSPLTSKGVG